MAKIGRNRRYFRTVWRDSVGDVNPFGGGQKEYILDWTGKTAASAVISVRLTLSATPQVLPVSETLIRGSGAAQTRPRRP